MPVRVSGLCRRPAKLSRSWISDLCPRTGKVGAKKRIAWGKPQAASIRQNRLRQIAAQQVSIPLIAVKICVVGAVAAQLFVNGGGFEKEGLVFFGVAHAGAERRFRTVEQFSIRRGARPGRRQGKENLRC